MRALVWLLGSLCAVPCIGAVGCDNEETRGDRAVSDLRDAVVKSGLDSRPVLRIADYAPFEWDRVRVLGPYDEPYGYSVRFIAGGNEVEKGFGDVGANMDCLAESAGGITRGDAYVRVVTHKYRSRGGIYRVLVPAWGGTSGRAAARKCLADHGPFD